MRGVRKRASSTERDARISDKIVNAKMSISTLPSLRSILSFALAVVASLLLASCGGGDNLSQTEGTYTPQQLATIQRYLEPVQQVRDRMPELQESIETRNWADVENFTHGPLGSLREDLFKISRNFNSPDDRKALQLSRNLFSDLERIDAAAGETDVNRAAAAYLEAVEDFDAFLELVPGEENLGQA